MKNSLNILFIAFLLVFSSSCTKFCPLEEKDNYEYNNDVEDNSTENNILKSGESGETTSGDSSVSGITDPEHDEDFDADASQGITDTENEEDHDKDDANG